MSDLMNGKSKPSIGILTLYYNNTNYGALLQAYALQKVIENCGAESWQISYDMATGALPYRREIHLHQIPIKICKRFRLKLWARERAGRVQAINKFAEKIPHTRLVTAQNIESLNRELDKFVCGSDQIWNPIGWQPTFFLDFVERNHKKIAYAASMARNDLTEQEQNFACEYLKTFDAISVRENRSAELLQKMHLPIKVEVMPDPAFLLPAEEWEKLLLAPQEKAPYIFAYFLGNNMQQREEVIRFAERNKCKVKYIPYLHDGAYWWDQKHQNIVADKQGVEDFLGWIKNAQAVITDSFHGTAFSLIFNKRFVVFDRFTEANPNSMNSRLETLLATVHREKNRMQHMPEYIEEIPAADNVCQEAIQTMQDRGTDFLRKHCLER